MTRRYIIIVCLFVTQPSLLVADCSWMLDEYIEEFDTFGLPKKMNVDKMNQYILGLAKEPGVDVIEVARPFGEPVYKIKIHAQPNRQQTPSPMRVLLTAGVHGNEPIGATTALQMIELFLSKPRLRENFEITVVVVNPPSLREGTRRTPDGVDLNRTFANGQWAQGYDGIREALESETFEIGIDLHGGPNRTEFFLIKGREDGSFTERVLQAIDAEPLLPSYSGDYPGFAGIPSNPKVYKMIAPGHTMSINPGTLKQWMQDRPTWWSATLEYPGKMDSAQAHTGLFRMAVSAMWNARKLAPPLYRGRGGAVPPK